MRLPPLRTALALLTPAPLAPGAGQQVAASAAVGERVRIVTTTGDRLIGELRVVVGDTLVVTVPGVRGRRDMEFAVPASQVQALYVSRRRGTRGSRAVRGAALGALAGGVTGFALGAQCGECGGGAIALGIAVFAPVGAVLGAVLGATTAGSEQWEQLAWPPQPATPRGHSDIELEEAVVLRGVGARPTRVANVVEGARRRG
jgi:hypothetical protein